MAHAAYWERYASKHEGKIPYKTESLTRTAVEKVVKDGGLPALPPGWSAPQPKELPPSDTALSKEATPAFKAVDVALTHALRMDGWRLPHSHTGTMGGQPTWANTGGERASSPRPMVEASAADDAENTWALPSSEHQVAY